MSDIRTLWDAGAPQQPGGFKDWGEAVSDVLTALDSEQVTTDQATVDLDLPSGYRRWVVRVRARCEFVGTSRNLHVRLLPSGTFNSNYDRVEVPRLGVAPVQATDVDVVIAGRVPSASDISTSFATGEVTIDREGAVGRPTVKGETYSLVTEGGTEILVSRGWGVARNNATPDGIRFTLGSSASFVNGSRFSVYGIR